MRKRWIRLCVENEVGVLARITGLFSGKSYNLNSLSVGPSEDDHISWMTISLISDDQTFEQVKKQLNRCVEVIKVMDLTDTTIYLKELVYIKLIDCTASETTNVFRLVQVFPITILDYDTHAILIECIGDEDHNNKMIHLFEKMFEHRMTLLRSGSVAIEALHDNE